MSKRYPGIAVVGLDFGPFIDPRGRVVDSRTGIGGGKPGPFMDPSG